LAEVLMLRLLAINDPFTLDTRGELSAELTALAGESGSREVGWHAAYHRTAVALESGDIVGANGALAELERLAAELRQPFYVWVARVGRGMLAGMRGAPDAEEQAVAAFELGTGGGQPDALIAFGAQLSNIRHNQGRLGELADAIRANVDAQPHVPAWRAALVRLYFETDQVAEARKQVDILRVNGFENPLNWLWTGYVVTLSEVVSQLHDASAAAVLYERLRPIAAQVDVLAGVLFSGGSYSLHCGMLAGCLGRWIEAERHFTDALAMNERLGARPYVVRTRRAWATMCLDRGDPRDTARARELIAAGRAEAETLGMAREIVHLERLRERMESAATG